MPSFFYFSLFCSPPHFSHRPMLCLSHLYFSAFFTLFLHLTSLGFFFFISQKCATSWGFGSLFHSPDQLPVEFRFSSSPPLPVLLFFLHQTPLMFLCVPWDCVDVLGDFNQFGIVSFDPCGMMASTLQFSFPFFSPFQASLGTPSNTADHYRSHFSWVTWCHLLLLSCWHRDEQNNGDLCSVCGSCLDSAPSSKQSLQVCGHNSFWSSEKGVSDCSDFKWAPELLQWLEFHRPLKKKKKRSWRKDKADLHFISPVAHILCIRSCLFAQLKLKQ